MFRGDHQNSEGRGFGRGSNAPRRSMRTDCTSGFFGNRNGSNAEGSSNFGGQQKSFGESNTEGRQFGGFGVRNFSAAAAENNNSFGGRGTSRRFGVAPGSVPLNTSFASTPKLEAPKPQAFQNADSGFNTDAKLPIHEAGAGGDAAQIKPIETPEVAALKQPVVKPEVVALEKSVQKLEIAPQTVDKPKEEEVESAELKEFRQKLYNAFSKGLHGVFVFQVGDKNVNVSKMVFAAQSAEFERLMLSDAEEAKTNVSKIDGLPVEAVEQFVEYIHLGEIGKLDQHAEHLLKLAKKYGLKELEDACSKHVSSTVLSDKNIVQRLAEAYKQKDEKARQEALEYITSRDNNGVSKSKSILVSEDWQKLAIAERDLSLQILQDVILKQ